MNHESRAWLVAALFTCAVVASDAHAQAVQAVHDADVGVRFNMPKDWQWRSRQSDVFVNCAPKIESRPGMPGCYFTVQKHRLAQGQVAITDADRAKWKAWTVSDGMRFFVSARDLKVAGYPAYEVVVKQGREKGAAAGPRVFVLIPQHGVIDAWLYAHWNDEDQTRRIEPAFRAALESLTPAK